MRDYSSYTIPCIKPSEEALLDLVAYTPVIMEPLNQIRYMCDGQFSEHILTAWYQYTGNEFSVYSTRNEIQASPFNEITVNIDLISIESNLDHTDLPCIEGKPVSLIMIKKSSGSISICGPHDGQYMLLGAAVKEFLDQYGGIDEIISNFYYYDFQHNPMNLLDRYS